MVDLVKYAVVNRTSGIPVNLNGNNTFTREQVDPTQWREFSASSVLRIPSASASCSSCQMAYALNQQGQQQRGHINNPNESDNGYFHDPSFIPKKSILQQEGPWASEFMEEPSFTSKKMILAQKRQEMGFGYKPCQPSVDRHLPWTSFVNTARASYPIEEPCTRFQGIYAYSPGLESQATASYWCPTAQQVPRARTIIEYA
jgi:hypothetical protein